MCFFPVSKETIGMQKLKTALLILLTMMLLVLGAALPKIAAAAQDGATVNNSGSSPIRSVALELSQDKPLSLLEKAALLADGVFYSIAANDAAMTQEEVLTAIEGNLAPYYHADLVPYNWKDIQVKAAPYFVYGSNQDESSHIFWVVSIGWDSAALQSCSLDLYVDDETGEILYIQYTSGSPLDVYDPETYVDIFCDAYFESLGMPDILDNPEAYGVKYILLEDLGPKETPHAGMRYTFCGDIELVVEFMAFEQGLYLVLE